MSLRDSLDLIKAVNPEGGYAVLENEIMGERAASLGAAEQRVAKAVAAYNSATPGQRSEQLAAAQNAVWAYFVQRELCGFKRHQDVIAAFAIPRAVLNGLGAVRQ
ncbi:DUF6665 family protein [Pelagibacterium sp.]|uniref:DUF6665 family protein n=1 Tax=Pelagibacterium sp. TaxID=1967288 RepID=UPI003BA88338